MGIEAETGKCSFLSIVDILMWCSVGNEHAKHTVFVSLEHSTENWISRPWRTLVLSLQTIWWRGKHIARAVTEVICLSFDHLAVVSPIFFGKQNQMEVGDSTALPQNFEIFFSRNNSCTFDGLFWWTKICTIDIWRLFTAFVFHICHGCFCLLQINVTCWFERKQHDHGCFALFLSAAIWQKYVLFASHWGRFGPGDPFRPVISVISDSFGITHPFNTKLIMVDSQRISLYVGVAYWKYRVDLETFLSGYEFACSCVFFCVLEPSCVHTMTDFHDTLVLLFFLVTNKRSLLKSTLEIRSGKQVATPQDSISSSTVSGKRSSFFCSCHRKDGASFIPDLLHADLLHTCRSWWMMALWKALENHSTHPSKSRHEREPHLAWFSNILVLLSRTPEWNNSGLQKWFCNYTRQPKSTGPPSLFQCQAVCRSICEACTGALQRARMLLVLRALCMPRFEHDFVAVFVSRFLFLRVVSIRISGCISLSSVRASDFCLSLHCHKWMIQEKIHAWWTIKDGHWPTNNLRINYFQGSVQSGPLIPGMYPFVFQTSLCPEGKTNAVTYFQSHLSNSPQIPWTTAAEIIINWRWRLISDGADAGQTASISHLILCLQNLAQSNRFCMQTNHSVKCCPVRRLYLLDSALCLIASFCVWNLVISSKSVIRLAKLSMNDEMLLV